MIADMSAHMSIRMSASQIHTGAWRPASMRTCLRTCRHACLHAFVGTRLRALVCLHTSERMSARMPVHIVVARIVMASIRKAFIAMAYIVMAYVVVATHFPGAEPRGDHRRDAELLQHRKPQNCAWP